MDSTHDLTLPIGTSTFNPETSVAVTGTLLPLELRPECYQTPAEDWGRCVSCWSSGRIGNQNGPVLNHNEIITASTVPPLHPAPTPTPTSSGALVASSSKRALQQVHRKGAQSMASISRNLITGKHMA